jgi:hypothetical protein
MSININDYDLITLIETALSEDSETPLSGERSRAAKFVADSEDAGTRAPTGKKAKKGKKGKINQAEKKDEDFDIIEDEEEEDTEESVEEKPEPTTVNLGDAIIYEKFVDDLNMFRAAHSFSDKEIATELRAYFDGLTREEKQVLHVLIKGLIHVTMMDVKGKSAKTPSDFSLDIKKTGATSREKQKSLNKKIELEKKGKKVDNNTPIKTPIKIGESKQNKNDVLRVLNSNKA